MNSKSLAFLALLATLTATLSAWALPTTWADLQSPLTEDTTIAVGGSIEVGGTIDLAGHRLYLEGLTGLSGTGSFTDSSSDKSKPGVLHLILAGDVENQTVDLSGNLQLVVDGGRVFSAKKLTQTYTGGNVISNGTLKITMDKQTLADTNNKPLGAVGGSIDIYPDGTLDTNGKYNFSGVYDINLHGGTIYNAAKRSSTSQPFNPTITLVSNSTFKTSNEYTFSGKIDLGGRKLEVIANSTLIWFPKEVKNGILEISGTKLILSSATGLNMPSVELVENNTFNLNGQTLIVSNYVANANTVNTSASGVLQVQNSFIPNTDCFFGPTMMDGSTIDLSGKEEESLPWNATGVAFESGATVTIHVGERSVQAGYQLVTWSAPDYTGCTFVLSGTQVEGLVLGWDEKGIVVQAADKTVTQAMWTGEAEDGDVTNPENWMCKTAGDETIPGRLPDSGVAVTIPYEALATINCPVGADLVCKTLTVSGDKPDRPVTLTADRDWRGLGPLPDFPFSIELDGHNLALQLASGVSAADLTIRNSSETVAALCVAVASGDSFENTLVTLAGNLTLVKEGQGTFVATKCPQEYTGVTIVSNGVLKCQDNADMNAEKGASPFGAQLRVDVAKNGILDPAGSYYWAYHTVVLQGGMISNTVARHGMSSDQYNAANRGSGFNPAITLQAHSVFAVHDNYNYQGNLNCNGHELEVWIRSGRSLRWCPTASDNAILRVTGSGAFYTLKNFPINSKTLSLIMDDQANFHMAGSLSISNYTAKSTSSTFDYENNASPTMSVYGTFKPVANHFVGCTMQNRSTIDLSEKKDVWSTQGFAWGKGTVDFASGATVTIDASGRELSDDMKIVEWAATPTNLDGLTFKLDEKSKADGYRIKKTDAGLFVEIDTGSGLTVAEVTKALSGGKVVLDGVPFDLLDKTAAEIKEIMNKSADNGLTVNENLILGIEQEENGRFEKKPFLKADAGAQTKEDTITFSFGGIDPKVDKADITYLIESATNVGGGADAGGWKPLMSDKIPGKDASATVELPKQDEPAVKYYRVKFTVSEKAVSGDPANQ